jgi:hypothetical protein
MSYRYLAYYFIATIFILFLILFVLLFLLIYLIFIFLFIIIVIVIFIIVIVFKYEFFKILSGVFLNYVACGWSHAVCIAGVFHFYCHFIWNSSRTISFII